MRNAMKEAQLALDFRPVRALLTWGFLSLLQDQHLRRDFRYGNMGISKS